MEEYAYATEQFSLLCATRTNYIASVSVEANRLLRAVLTSHFLRVWVPGLWWMLQFSVGG